MESLEKQNILFFTRTMGLGGTENVILQLCEILQPYVNKIIVCSCGGINTDKLTAMNIKHYKIPDISKRNLSNIIKISITLRHIINYENITIIHSHHRMAALYSELLAPKTITKLVNVHNIFYDKKLLTQFAYRHTKLIAVGEGVKKNLVNYYKIPDSKITIIFNSVKSFDGNIKKDKLISSIKNNNKILIGNIGRLSRQKGMEYFIEAAKIVHDKHPDVFFVIVGSGEEYCKLKNLVKEKRLDNALFFLGYRTDIQNIMSQLDFVVLSSLWEGFPLTPIEAFSVGKTVVATCIDGTIEIVKDNINGLLVPPYCSEKLALKINYLIENPDIRSLFEMNAKSQYKSFFSFDTMKQSYIEYYKKL